MRNWFHRVALVLVFSLALARVALASYKPANTPAGPYSFLYCLTANQAVTNNTTVVLASWTSIYDNGAWYNGGTNTQKFIAPASGRYLVVFQVCHKAATNVNSTGAYLQRVQLNGTALTGAAPTLTTEQWSSCNTDFLGTPFVAVVNLTSGDDLRFVAVSTGGNSTAVGTGAMGSAGGSTYASAALLASQ